MGLERGPAPISSSISTGTSALRSPSLGPRSVALPSSSTIRSEAFRGIASRMEAIHHTPLGAKQRVLAPTRSLPTPSPAAHQDRPVNGLQQLLREPHVTIRPKTTLSSPPSPRPIGVFRPDASRFSQKSIAKEMYAKIQPAAKSFVETSPPAKSSYKTLYEWKPPQPVVKQIVQAVHTELKQNQSVIEKFPAMRQVIKEHVIQQKIQPLQEARQARRLVTREQIRTRENAINAQQAVAVIKTLQAAGFPEQQAKHMAQKALNINATLSTAQAIKMPREEKSVKKFLRNRMLHIAKEPHYLHHLHLIKDERAFKARENEAIQAARTLLAEQSQNKKITGLAMVQQMETDPQPKKVKSKLLEQIHSSQYQPDGSYTATVKEMAKIPVLTPATVEQKIKEVNNASPLPLELSSRYGGEDLTRFLAIILNNQKIDWERLASLVK